MSEHELWNELGNLYFMSGTYNQAAYAYHRSIQLDGGYGRPYCNLALTYVKQGRFSEAVDLYQRSIELLVDDREKAITWYRLGDVYRHLKDYRDAILAYQQADLLDADLSQDRTESGQILYGGSEAHAIKGISVDAVASEPQTSPVEALPHPSEEPAAALIDSTTAPPVPLVEALAENHAPPGEADFERSPEPPESTMELAVPVSERAVEDDLPPVESVETSPLVPDSTVELSAPAEAPLPLAEEDVSGQPAAAFAPIPGDSAEQDTHPPFEGEAAVDPPVVQDEDPAERVSSMELEVPSEEVSAELEPQQQEDIQLVPGPLPTYEETPDSFYQSSPEAQEDLTSGNLIVAALEADGAAQDEVVPTAFIVPEEDEIAVPEVHPDESGAVDHVGSEVPDPELEEIEGEIAKFKHVVQTNPRNASAWATLGTLCKSARKYRDAIMAYQQAVSVDPSKAHYHHHLGILYAIEGREEDAIKAFQEVIELEPNHSLANASLGGYYRKMGLEELAEKHIGKAMKNFYNSENEYNRACLEALCGNTEQSIELLRIALKNKQTYVDWVLRDPDLDSIRRDPRFKQLISDYASW